MITPDECVSTCNFFIVSQLFFASLTQGSCIGLYFINRPEWLVVDHACSAYSYVSVPLYDTLGLSFLFIFISLIISLFGLVFELYFFSLLFLQVLMPSSTL